MKGVICKGIQEMVEARAGADAWEAIRRDARCGEPAFSPGLNYPDEMAVNLIAASARLLGMAEDDVMVEFGKFWVPNVAAKSYPALCALAGTNARDFLRHADRVHRQVTVSIADAHPPRLITEDLPDGRLAIRYVSRRKLCPILQGLILGVGIHFGERLGVTETCCTRNGDDSCLFDVSFLDVR